MSLINWPDALDRQVEGDALGEEAGAQDGQGQVDALNGLGVEQAPDTVVGRQSGPDTEDAHSRDEGRHVLHVGVAVGVVLARVLVGVVDAVGQDHLQFQQAGLLMTGTGIDPDPY